MRHTKYYSLVAHLHFLLMILYSSQTKQPRTPAPLIGNTPHSVSHLARQSSQEFSGDKLRLKNHTQYATTHLTVQLASDGSHENTNSTWGISLEFLLHHRHLLAASLDAVTLLCSWRVHEIARGGSRICSAGVGGRLSAA